jgi:hypothetical protein
MSDPNGTSHRTPLSSSSSRSGTQALGVTIDADKQPTTAQAEETTAPAPAMAAGETVPPGEEAETAASDTDPNEPAPAIISVPAETPVPESELPEAAANVEPAGSEQSDMEELRATVRESLVQSEAKQEQAIAVLQRAPADFTSVIDDARNDAARLTFKLMEFAQANLHSNIELARDYATARSLLDMVGVQTAYFQRQMELMNRQADELRKLTAEISRKAAEFHLSVAHR